MGGDYAPQNVVAGTIDALVEANCRFSVVLVGKEESIHNELQKHPSRNSLRENAYSVVNAREVIDFSDSPTAAVKTKKDSSLAVGVNLHREGKADAFVSAGHTGAMLSASTLILGRIGGISRPTIGALIPTTSTPSLLVDAGTNVDCKPRHLFEFGVMGAIYVEAMLGKTNPSVGLLSIGEEENKGDELTLEAFSLMKQSKLNFFGNIEGRDVLKGKVDVVVCDGFVGNVLLKFGESVPSFFKSKFTAFAEKSIFNKFVGLIARSGMRSVMKELDYQEHGGVPLLGVNGVSIIGHGGSTPKAIKNMIFRAEEMVQRQVNPRIQEVMRQYT
jgi:glycerol-3-phosphate acyltransferase PlsX